MLEAYQLTGLLLAEVRAVVSATRDQEPADLCGALHASASRVAEPQILLDLESSALSGDSPVAHALFRCAQEAITNSVKHSGARRIWIECKSTSDEHTLTAWDDGRGNPAFLIGNGLRGMEERIRDCNGTCAFRNRPGAGFEIQVRIPVSQRVVA